MEVRALWLEGFAVLFGVGYAAAVIIDAVF